MAVARSRRTWRMKEELGLRGWEWSRVVSIMWTGNERLERHSKCLQGRMEDGTLTT